MINVKKAAISVVIASALLLIAASFSLVPKIAVTTNKEYIFLIIVIMVILGIRQADIVRTKRVNENFATQYSQMDSIINNSPFIIFLKDINGKILLANNHLATFLNIKMDKIIGKNIYKIYESSQIDIEEDRKIISTGNSTTSERQLEMNHKMHWFKITKIPIKDMKGKVIEVIVILVNTDIEKELEGSKTSYIENLTHDLKTPTYAQIRAADLLLSGLFGELSEEQKEIITQIKSSCNYMNDLIFTILDSYHYENGQTKINPEKFDIVKLVRETSNEIYNLLSVKGQQIRIYPDQKEIYVVADKFQIKRVIVNFLGNAITYGFKNSIININIKNGKTSIKLNIRNKSEYIPEDTLKEIFKKYKHNKNAKYQKAATGLGLYLSKQIIDAHNGNIYAKSDIKQNCDFGFELPKKTSQITDNRISPPELPADNKILKFSK